MHDFLNKDDCFTPFTKRCIRESSRMHSYFNSKLKYFNIFNPVVSFYHFFRIRPPYIFYILTLFYLFLFFCMYFLLSLIFLTNFVFSLFSFRFIFYIIWIMCLEMCMVLGHFLLLPIVCWVIETQSNFLKFFSVKKRTSYIF